MDYLKQLQEWKEQELQQHRQMFIRLLGVSPDKHPDQFERFHDFLRFGGNAALNDYPGTENIQIRSETATIERRKKGASRDMFEWIDRRLKFVRFIGRINNQHVHVIAELQIRFRKSIAHEKYAGRNEKNQAVQPTEDVIDGVQFQKDFGLEWPIRRGE